MNVDSHYQAGKYEAFCGDYSLAGESGSFAYAIVCDGDVDAAQVDFGVRAVALASREVIRLTRTFDLKADLFAAFALGKAMTTTALFGQLGSRAFDTTLMVAWVREGLFRAYVYGDGLVVHWGRDTARVVRVEPGQDGSDYPVLLLDESRKDDRTLRNRGKTYIDCAYPNGAEAAKPRLIPAFKPVVVEGLVQPGDTVALFNNGWERFERGGAFVNWREQLPKFIKAHGHGRVMPGFIRDCIAEYTQLGEITQSAGVAVAMIQV